MGRLEIDFRSRIIGLGVGLDVDTKKKKYKELRMIPRFL